MLNPSFIVCRLQDGRYLKEIDTNGNPVFAIGWQNASRMARFQADLQAAHQNKRGTPCYVSEIKLEPQAV